MPPIALPLLLFLSASSSITVANVASVVEDHNHSSRRREEHDTDANLGTRVDHFCATGRPTLSYRTRMPVCLVWH